MKSGLYKQHLIFPPSDFKKISFWPPQPKGVCVGFWPLGGDNRDGFRNVCGLANYRNQHLTWDLPIGVNSTLSLCSEIW